MADDDNPIITTDVPSSLLDDGITNQGQLKEFAHTIDVMLNGAHRVVDGKPKYLFLTVAWRVDNPAEVMTAASSHDQKKMAEVLRRVIASFDAPRMMQ